jgi:hypothetical protein
MKDMPDYLLIGAGFSRNWGGWLASEAFEYLLGTPEVVNDPGLRTRLWAHQSQGGFEGALAELQAEFARDAASARGPLMTLQDAVKRMFGDMNEGLMQSRDWTFGQQNRSRQVGVFLTRFDAIFTLNQDVLLEHHYANSHFEAGGPRRWNGSDLPGMSRIQSQEGSHTDSWAHSTWVPMQTAEFTPDAQLQPIYKLHGSSNWTRADGDPLLIIGGAKTQGIGQSPILNEYATEFKKRLSIDGARLMVIGYGFRDQHINATISECVERGLKLFIIAPEGAELARRLNPTSAPGQIKTTTPLELMFEKSLIGASRRSLREIFSSDDVEYAKVMRFFFR